MNFTCPENRVADEKRRLNSVCVSATNVTLQFTILTGPGKVLLLIVGMQLQLVLHQWLDIYHRFRDTNLNQIFTF